MKQVDVFRWYLPPKPWAGPRVKEYLSNWKMTAQEAAGCGALRPEPSTREVREVPETDEERREVMRLTDTSILGGKAPPRE